MKKALLLAGITLFAALPASAKLVVLEDPMAKGVVTKSILTPIAGESKARAVAICKRGEVNLWIVSPHDVKGSGYRGAHVPINMRWNDLDMHSQTWWANGNPSLLRSKTGKRYVEVMTDEEKVAVEWPTTNGMIFAQWDLVPVRNELKAVLEACS